VRALSLSEIRDSLHDRFRLLTGGARTAVRRQQTLRASVDWSQALLTESERIMFRRLAVFPSGFDLHAAQAVAGEGELQPHQILDLLTLLVDKSLVVAENASGRRRYRLTETVRQYALEKLGEAGEADKVRDRHRDHYTAMVAVLDDPFTKQSLRVVEQAETEFDNLRAAFGWSRERNAIEEALRIASSLQPLWLSRGRILEGLSWFYAIPADETRPTFDVTPAVHARALADKAMLASVICAPDSLERVERALAIAREIGEAGLLLRALTACGSTAVFIPDVARPYLAEALELARALGDTWRMSQVLWWQAFTATVAGEPAAALEAGFEGSRLVADIGDPFVARMCPILGHRNGAADAGRIHCGRGPVPGAARRSGGGARSVRTARRPVPLGHTLAHLGDVDGARSAAATAAELGAEFGGFVAGIGYAPLARAALAAGDVAVATEACEVACQTMGTHPIPGANVTPIAEIALARGDLAMARRFADETVSLTSGFNLSLALIARTRVAIAEGDPEQADRDAHKALAVAAAVDSHAPIPEALE
jgi:hypothetical protein